MSKTDFETVGWKGDWNPLKTYKHLNSMIYLVGLLEKELENSLIVTNI